MRLSIIAALLSTLLEPLDSERRAQPSVSIGFVAYSSQPGTVGIAESGRVQIDAIWLALQDVKARPQASCTRETAKAVLAGAFTVELAKRISTAPDASALDAGRYCALDLQLRRSRGTASGAPDDLKGASIVIKGRRADGARFVVRSRIQKAVLLSALDLEGFEVSSGKVSWILGVDLSRWFAGVDLALAETTGHGRTRTARIDDKSNRELLAAFNANVEGGFSLFADRNADRNLDSDERETPIAARR